MTNTRKNKNDHIPIAFIASLMEFNEELKYPFR
jgi:hypothetical protein